MLNIFKCQSLTSLDDELKSRDIHVMVTNVCMNTEHGPMSLEITINIEAVQYHNDQTASEKVHDIVKAFDEAKAVVLKK